MVPAGSFPRMENGGYSFLACRTGPRLHYLKRHGWGWNLVPLEKRASPVVKRVKKILLLRRIPRPFLFWLVASPSRTLITPI